MWTAKLRDNYNNNKELWESYSEEFGLAQRLGFKSAEEAWEANPTIQGSAHPNDFQVVKNVKILSFDPSQVTLVFKCLLCDVVEREAADDLVECGTAICSECDADCRLIGVEVAIPKPI